MAANIKHLHGDDVRALFCFCMCERLRHFTFIIGCISGICAATCIYCLAFLVNFRMGRISLFGFMSLIPLLLKHTKDLSALYGAHGHST